QGIAALLSLIKSALRQALARFGLQILKKRDFETLVASAGAADDLRFIEMLPDRHLRAALDLLPLSKSQLRQDLFVLSAADFKHDGYFVEFGATDGKTLSNTWLLEKHFGWTGILAEPARIWRDKLTAERSAQIDFDCVWHRTGDELEFVETEWAELSTL